MDKKIIIITGYYGSGKTNLAVNIALYLKKFGSVSAVDLDTVNPYFRCSDFEKMFGRENITAYSPMYAGTNLDTPVLDFDMEGIIAQSDYTVIDVGGDDAGAYALGRYRHVFEKHKEDIAVLYVYNRWRREDFSPAEAAEIMENIQRASGLKCTALVNNSNLGSETKPEDILASLDFERELEEITGLKTVSKDGFTVKRLVTLPWERNAV